MPRCAFPAEILNKIMHGEIAIGSSKLMLTDGQLSPDSKFSGITLTLQVTTDAEAEQRFTALAERGNITMPLTETFFATAFGTVTDRFGVSWMVINQKPHP